MLAAAAAAGALFVFGRRDGNIIPQTITFTRAGVVERDGAPTGRILTPTTMRHLRALAHKERFATLPSTILCSGVLPDVATGFVIYGGHKVREHGGCNARFTTLYNTLYRASGVR
jgi:hypothetical protein